MGDLTGTEPPSAARSPAIENQSIMIGIFVGAKGAGNQDRRAEERHVHKFIAPKQQKRPRPRPWWVLAPCLAASRPGAAPG
jgi:hypothetical protein